MDLINLSVYGHVDTYYPEKHLNKLKINKTNVLYAKHHINKKTLSI